MSSSINLFIKRSIATSACCNGKRNFRKFLMPNKRGTRIFKESQRLNPDPDIPIDKRGVRDVGFMDEGKFKVIPEKIPELIVPDLTDCKLKPYVSYRTPEIIQSEFTPEDLFNTIYAPKILKDFQDGSLDENGQSLNPSEYEKQDPETAKLKARQTGSDIF